MVQTNLKLQHHTDRYHAPLDDLYTPSDTYPNLNVLDVPFTSEQHLTAAFMDVFSHLPPWQRYVLRNLLTQNDKYLVSSMRTAIQS